MSETGGGGKGKRKVNKRYDEKLQKTMPVKAKYFSPEDIIAALKRSGGFITVAARSLGVATSTVYDYIRDYPEIKAAQFEIEDQYLDIAEAELIKQIQGGNLSAAIFYLKTKGKRRGYIERSEMTGLNGSPVAQVVQVTVVDTQTKDLIDKLRSSGK